MVYDEVTIKLWREGDPFGISSLLYDLPAGLTLRARSHADIIVLTKDNFLDVCRSHCDVINDIETEAKKLFGLPVVLNIAPQT